MNEKVSSKDEAFSFIAGVGLEPTIRRWRIMSPTSD